MNNPLFRPPAEADSLILQIDQGCPHNHCTFCGMYRGMRHQRRSPADVRTIVLQECAEYPTTQRVFLADGDVMLRPFAELETILTLLNERLPQLSRVSLYANGSSIAGKSALELRALRALKLHTLYMGLESGDEEILRRCRKGETAARMADAAMAAQAAGLRMSVMILLGLGGLERTAEHAANTATVLNRMQPRLLSALRVIPVEGTELHDDAVSGRFQMLTEHQIVREMRELIAQLELTATVFRTDHSSNVVALDARFPRDKQRLLTSLDALLASDTLDRNTPGRTPHWL